MSYDAKFYANIRPGCQAAAAKLIPRLVELFHPISMLDVGCGEGWFLSAGEAAGIETCIGVDSHFYDDSMAISKNRYMQLDLETRGWNIQQPISLVLCLEVAEHLSAESGQALIKEICEVTDVVVFSAAIPGQGGEDHKNEQWQSYWVEAFNRHGFVASTQLRDELWNDSSIPAWYRQNWILFIRDKDSSRIPSFRTPAEFNIVHPEIFRASERVVTQLVITDGRKEYLQQTLDSAGKNIIGNITHRIMVDDSCNPEYAAWLDATYPEFTIAHSTTRLGFAGAIQKGWSMLPRNTEFCLHLEDDFTFNERWDQRDAINILDSHPDVAQIALRRQAVGHEVNFGGFVEQFPDSYTDMEWGGLHWFEHKRFFTTNPSLYPVRITELGWPDAPHSEGKFGIERLFPAGYKTAFLGKKSDPPKVHHIGEIRNGTGY